MRRICTAVVLLPRASVFGFDRWYLPSYLQDGVARIRHDLLNLSPVLLLHFHPSAPFALS
jgi:hypothetical protein